MRSKWLRDDADVDWEAKLGRNDNIPDSRVRRTTELSSEQFAGRMVRSDKAQYLFKSATVGANLDITKNRGLSHRPRTSIGLEQDELDGLNLEERKRKRTGPGASEELGMDEVPVVEGINKENKNMDADLSGMDCSATSNNILATLAVQASRLQ